MELESQKKRTMNFTSDERRILSELVLKYREIIENKCTDATTNATKMKGWIRLAEEFNTISTYCHRKHPELKRCWENIKRQTKKDRAARKKNIFMTGGGKPPSPSPTIQGSDAVVEAILGPALEGIPNIYDSDAVDVLGNENIELNYTVEPYIINENNFEQGKNNEENIERVSGNNQSNACELIINNENIKELREQKKNDTHTSKSILKENNETDTWSSWTPKNLKTPCSSQLKPKPNEEDWLTRRRPKPDCLSDTLTKEKIKLVKLLQENAEKESNIRLAILEEQLKQEKLKTKKLMD